MKQITMNYDLYIQELKDAKTKGFNVIPNLNTSLQKLIKALDLNDEKLYYIARRDVLEILRDLDKIDKEN